MGNLSSNLVSRLRKESTERFQESANALLAEAADEIERLKRELDDRRALTGNLINEKDTQIDRLCAALSELILECDQSVELECVHSSDTVERARESLRGAVPADETPGATNAR